MKYIKVVSILTFALGLVLTGCGKSKIASNSSRIGVLNPPTPEQIAAVQVGPDHPCLSLEKAQKYILKSGPVRTFVYDLEIRDGAKPISWAFNASALNNTTLDKTETTPNPDQDIGIRQSDCKTLDMDGLGLKIELETATPTELTTKRTELLGSDGKPTGSFMQFRVIFYETNRFLTESEMSYYTPHKKECGGGESHPVWMKFATDFGSPLPSPPARSENMNRIIGEWESLKGEENKEARKARETEYCKAVNPDYKP